MLSPHSPRCVYLSGRAGRGNPPFSLQLIKLELSADLPDCLYHGKGLQKQLTKP